MNMKNLDIASSSFLIPGNHAWDCLGNVCHAHFSEYGDWSSCLISPNPTNPLAVIIFFDDFFAKNISFDDSKVILSRILSLIENRLNYSEELTMLAFSGGDDVNLIRRAKSVSNLSKVKIWFSGKLEELAAKNNHLFWIDLDPNFSKIGFNTIFDTRNWYFSHCRLSSNGLDSLAKSIYSVLSRHGKSSSKVLVLDCDNTLWGGVIGEDGLSGIRLGQDGIGQAFVDFQKAVKSLIEEGTLIALSSKNNEPEVWEVFDNHQAMILTRRDVVAWKINWQDKSESIMELSQELDLGLDSFVFWDDNPVERDQVRNLLPQVNTIDCPSDVGTWSKILMDLDCFAKFSVTDDDLKKTEQYHGRAKFVRDSSSIIDKKSYLKSIALKPQALDLVDSNIQRAAQLCLKTNQYNLRTIRHSEKDLLKLSNENNKFTFLTSLKDVYGDHGIVGLACLRPLTTNIIFIDTLLMSCRVLGRHLESWILNEIVSRSREFGYQFLVGEFIPSKRNVVASNFFETHGFSPLEILADLKDIDELKPQHLNGSCFAIYLNEYKSPNMEIYDES